MKVYLAVLAVLIVGAAAYEPRLAPRADRSRPNNRSPPSTSTSRSSSSSSSSESSSSGWSDSGSPRAQAKIKIKSGRGGGKVATFTTPNDVDYHETLTGESKKKKLSGPRAGVYGNVASGGSIRAKSKGTSLTYGVDTRRGGTAILSKLVDGQPSVVNYGPGAEHVARVINTGRDDIEATLHVNGPGTGSLLTTKPRMGG